MQANTAGQQPSSQSPSPQPQGAIVDHPTAFMSLSGTGLPQQSPPSAPATGDDGDEWAFTSALPPGSAVKANEMLVVDSNLRAVVEVNRPAGDGPILLKATFSNNASQPIQDLTFQMAVTKVRGTTCFRVSQLIVLLGLLT